MDQLDLLAEADRRGVPATFVLTRIDEYPEWPAVLATDQSLVHDHAPSLAGSRWFAVNTRAAGTVGSAPLGPEEAARGLAGLAVDDLRRALAEEATRVRAASSGPSRAVPVGATGEQWREILEAELARRTTVALKRASIDLSASHVRCVREFGTGHGCVSVPAVLDRELYALSLRTARLLDAAANGVLRRVFREVLGTEPDGAALARVRPAVRRALADTGAEGRTLLLTATSGVATVAGCGPELAARRDAVLPPLGIAVSTGCLQMWQHRGNADKKECRRWLQQAIRAIETGLYRELTRQVADLHEAVTLVVTDAVDHGVLLA